MRYRKDGLNVDWDNPDLEDIRDRLCIVDTNTGCWLWQRGRNTSGYAHAYHQGRVQLVPRLLLAHTLSRPLRPYPEEMALHTCNRGHDGCISPDHLYEGSSRDNIRDSIVAGNNVWHANRSFDTPTARAIFSRVQSGESKRSLAREFGVSDRVIRLLCQGETYADDTADLRA